MADAAEECWCQAWKDAQKHLVDQVKKGLQMSDLEKWPSEAEIADFAASTHHACDKGRHKPSKLSELVRAVHKYSPVFDVFIQQQPFLVAIAWGTCRFLAQVLNSCVELQQKIASALIDIVPHLPKYKLEIDLHSKHQGVFNCVKALFTQIIIFLVRAREYGCQSKGVRLWKAAFSTTFDDILKHVQTCVSNLDRELNTAARHAQVHEFTKQDYYRGESSGHLQRIEENTRTLLSKHKQTTQFKGVNKMLCYDSTVSVQRHVDFISTERFINWLSASVLEADYIPEPEPSTCDRIYQHEEWKDWTTLGYPNTFLLTGVQGVGKSVYAKSIATKAKEHGDRIVLTHFFRGSAGDELSQAKSFAIGVLWQLCQEHSVTQCNELLPILRNFVPVLNTYKLARDSPLKRLLDLLSDILDVARNFLLVVDAIDECNTESALLHQYLLDLGLKLHAQVIATSRDRLLVQNGDNYTSRICLDKELVEPDIAYFVGQEIRRNPKFCELEKDISESVLRHSQGIFLHARLLMDDLRCAKSVNEQKAKMAKFASKVPEEYRRLFNEHSAKLTAPERGRRDDILRMLIAAKTLFTVQEITETLAFDDLTQTIDKGDIDFEPAEELTRLCQPFVKVSGNCHVFFIHDSAREFLLQHHLTKLESDIFLARKCLGILTRRVYRDWRLAANLLRRHLLAGTTYPSECPEYQVSSEEEEPALYEYAVLHFQDHVIALPHPPEDVITKLARFLLGVEFVVWSETVFDMRSQSGLGSQIAVYNKLLTWTKFLPAPVKAEVPIEDFYETAHVHLSIILEEQSKDKLLRYLPQIRNAQYFNGAGQSTQDWQKAYENKRSIVTGFTEILGSDSPVTLRFRASLLQEYFWQKRFQQALEELLIVSDLQRKFVGEDVPDLYTTLWMLGGAYHCLTRFEEALSTFTEAENALERLSGRSGRFYLLVGLYKGHTLEQLFRYDEAASLYDNVSKELLPVVGEGNGFVLMSRTAVGAIQRKQGKYEHAERNLLEGWGGRKQLFSININVCLDAAVQLALLYRDRGDGDMCIEVLDAVSDSNVYQLDFERLCQTKHIRALVAFDNGAYESPKLELLRLLHKASGPNRNENNRELLWVRTTLAKVMRRHGDGDEATMLFSELVEPIGQDWRMLPEEPEPPMRLRIAEQALHLVKRARSSDADDLLRRNGLKWVRDEDFWILGEGGPVTDTGCISAIGPPAMISSAGNATSPLNFRQEDIVHDIRTTSHDDARIHSHDLLHSKMAGDESAPPRGASRQLFCDQAETDSHQ